MLERYQVKEIVGPTSVEHVVIEQDGEQSMLPVDAVFADLGIAPACHSVAANCPALVLACP